MEEWKTIQNFESYKISNFWKVMRNGKELLQNTNNKGYLSVRLYKNGSYKKMYVHRLVAIEFIGNSKNLPTVNHIDFNKKNNHFNNLEWTTNAENVRHYYANNKREPFSDKHIKNLSDSIKIAWESGKFRNRKHRSTPIAYSSKQSS